MAAGGTPSDELEQAALRTQLARTWGWRLRLGLVWGVACGVLAVAVIRQLQASTVDVWRAVYFQNMSFRGKGVELHYPRLQLDWGRTQVHPRVRASRISARFDTCVELPRAADLLFWLEAKDGARLRVDGTELINTWNANALTRATKRMTLKAGAHPLDISFYNLSGAGRVVVRVSVDGGPLTPLDAALARLPAANSLSSCGLPEPEKAADAEAGDLPLEPSDEEPPEPPGP